MCFTIKSPAQKAERLMGRWGVNYAGMNHSKKDALIMYGLIAAFAATMLWGYASGDVQKLFTQRSPEEKAAAEQRAVEHMFGSDQPFNPAADNVTKEAANTRDTISWKTLSHAKLHIGKSTDAEFAGDVQALDGVPVTITGYMFPLQASGSQGHFLLSAYPPSCPYCLPAGPTELIEITDSKPITFTYEPITIHGAFQLLRDDALKEGMFYRMTQVDLQQSHRP